VLLTLEKEVNKRKPKHNKKRPSISMAYVSKPKQSKKQVVEKALLLFAQ